MVVVDCYCSTLPETRNFVTDRRLELEELDAWRLLLPPVVSGGGGAGAGAGAAEALSLLCRLKEWMLPELVRVAASA